VSEDRRDALASLIARVEAATGPDRRLDLDICAALGTLEYASTARGYTRMPHPELTASIDAALAFAERVLPGKGWRLLYSAMMDWRAHVEPNVGKLLPRVLILALLRALQAQASEMENTHE
jgi:hypothetical protein